MNINERFTPTPEEVVDIQLSAVMEEFELKDDLEDPEISIDEISAINTSVDKAKEIHETPINLEDCRIVNKMTRIRLTKEALEDDPFYIDDEDIEHNMFYLLGEVSQAPTHICVIGQSGKNYTMLHSGNFEIIPTQEC